MELRFTQRDSARLSNGRRFVMGKKRLGSVLCQLSLRPEIEAGIFIRGDKNADLGPA